MFSAFFSLFRKRPTPQAYAAYIALVKQARNQFFFTTLGVPDTLDGRFEVVVLHMFLLQHRLREDSPDFARFMSEVFFEEMDASIRELGIGDTGILHRIKKMGKAYHGRLQAYADGLAKDNEVLKAALARNLYGTVEEGDVAQLEAAAQYLRRMHAALAATDTATLTSGHYAWPAPELK
jgi:cytochrome b pre-mRNA-processing protein 3